MTHPRRTITKLDVALWTSATMIAAVVAFTLPHYGHTPGDQEVYALAAERVVAGEQFYRPDQERAFTYPPFCVLFFTPLTGLSETTRRGVWYFANYLMLAGVVLLTTVHLRRTMARSGPPTWVCFAIVYVLAARFVISPVEYQGHDQIVFLFTLLSIVAWSLSRESLSGMWAGLGAATKATPALMLPVYAWNRQWRACVTFAIVAVAATLLPDLLYPSADGGTWAVAWYRSFVSKVDVGTAADANGAWTSWNFLNQSLAGTLYRLSTPVGVTTVNLFDVSLWSPSAGVLKIVTTAGQVTVLLLIARATWGGWTRDIDDRERSALRLGQGAAVVCGMVLLSPMSSKAHFCVLLLPIGFLVCDLMYRRRDPVSLAAIATVFLLGTACAKDIVGKSVGDTLLAIGSLTWCTLACLVAITHVIASRSRDARVAPDVLALPDAGRESRTTEVLSEPRAAA